MVVGSPAGVKPDEDGCLRVRCTPVYHWQSDLGGLGLDRASLPMERHFFYAYDRLKKKIMFGGSNKTYLGVDFGTSSIKVVELGVDKHEPVLLNYGEVSLSLLETARSGDLGN